MKCPQQILIKHSEVTPGNVHQILDFVDCIKEECAWWREDIQMCAIKDLSLELGYTQLRLADIDHRLDAMTRNMPVARE